MSILEPSLNFLCPAHILFKNAARIKARNTCHANSAQDQVNANLTANLTYN